MRIIHKRNIVSFFVEIGAIICIVGSCETRLEQSSLIPSQFNDKEEILKDLRIDNFDRTLDSQAAIDVAKIHSLSLGVPTRGDIDREVLNVLPIRNEAGEPIMYVINYKNNRGYTIVSATKKYFPIIAETDEGTFDDRVYQSGVGILLEEHKQEIARNANLPQDSVAVFAGLWRRYINYKNQKSLPIQTRTGEDLPGLVSSSMALWESQGYSFQMLGDGCPDGLPQSEYERFCAIAESSTHPDYAEDYLIHSFILIANPDVAANNVHEPLMSTSWHQDEDYNYYSPICFVNPVVKFPVGCAAVASGQIMRYHEWPETYDWSLMPSSTATLTTAAFLRDLAIHEQMIYSYSDTSASATMHNVKAALINDFDYLCDADSVYNYGAIMNSIDLLRPVYVRGDSYYSGHAWVCDGYYTYPNSGYYELQCLDLTYPLTYVMSTSYGYYDQCRMFHNNWGEQGVANGWWQQDYYRSFNYNKKIISNIRPNN